MKNQTKSLRIFARVSADLYKRAKIEAKRRQRPLSFLIGEGLKRYLNKK